MKKHNLDKCDNLNCALCMNSLDFALPKEIVDAATNGKLVLFVGAGVSTEDRNAYAWTFYEEIKDELNIPDSEDISFSDLMGRYCNQVNGRRKLIRKIKERLDYLEAFPSVRQLASRFHVELSTIYPIQEIFTTNWDTLFETECGALPLVTAEDFAYWDYPERKVFKIHGSINNLGSIVATKEDYDMCYENLQTGLIGSYLKTVLATKVIVFIGFSFTDEDFLKIHSFLKKQMGNLLPHSYIVSINSDSKERFEGLGLIPLITDGTYFLRSLKRELVEDGIMMADERFQGIYSALRKVREENRLLHENYKVKENPEMIYASHYQDGLTHAFERILAKMHTGYYSHECNVIQVLYKYEDLIKTKLHHKKYLEVAYLRGYEAGLLYLINDDDTRKYLPLYYVFKSPSDLRTLRQYTKVAKDASKLHKAAYKFAVQLSKNLPEDLSIYRKPFLSL